MLEYFICCNFWELSSTGILLKLLSSLTAYGFTAYALGDPSVTVEEVTPSVFPSSPLLPSEVSFQDIITTVCLV